MSSNAASIDRDRWFPWVVGSVGSLILAAGFLALVNDVERWNAIWYVPAWYGYLLVLDACIFRLQGHSFVSHRRRELAAMLFWSVPFWFVFEAYNLVLKNWYYVFVLRTDWTQAIVTGLAFATVFPACFVHSELLKALGCWSELRSRPVKVQGPLMYFCASFGGLCTVLPLVWPRYAFWMVWGAALGVPEVINYRSGAPSLLRDLETGRPGRLLRLLLGGLWAGIAWESLNYWARCKWIYTVPGMEDWKLFEMPFLGFLGFPALSLEAFAFYALVCHALRGGRNWDATDSQPARAIPRLRYAFAASAAIMFSATTFVAVTNVNVESRRPLLAELEGMDGGAVAQLRTVGIRTPEQLHRAVETDGVAAFCRRTRLAAEQIERAYLHAALALHKGMGPRNAKLLLAAGVTRVVDLVLANPQDLYGRLLAVAAQYGFPPPRLAEVKVWIRAARVAGSIRR